MAKHDRLMNALTEIKSICSKHEDEDLGCGRKCPFIMAEDKNGFRHCEVMKFVQTDWTPDGWGSEE